MKNKLLSVIVTIIAIAAFTIAIAYLSHTPADIQGHLDILIETPLYYDHQDYELDEPYVHINPELSTPEPVLATTPYPTPEPTPKPTPESTPTPFIPIFTSQPLPDDIIDQIDGITFHDNTPFDHSFLSYLTVTHINFYGEPTIGHLIVAQEIGDEVLEIFQEIFEYGFPIYSIRLIDYFDAIDYDSMAANNSHAFNFRYIAGTNVISRHGFGMAIDINPIQNPYIRGDTIWPAAGAYYLDRDNVRPGMIVPGSVVYYAFINRGWTWGGHWQSPIDYHHFERR